MGQGDLIAGLRRGDEHCYVELVRAHRGTLLGIARRYLAEDDAYDAVKGADALLLLTEWREYQYPEFDRIKELMRTPVILDGRNIWVTYELADQGFAYDGVGILTDPA